MVAMYTFCFYFSVRLGSIIVGLLSMIQTLAMFFLILPLTGRSPKAISAQINAYRQGHNFLFITKYLDIISQYPKTFVWLTIALAITHILSCILLILGAYKCIHRLLLPYLVLEMPRLVFLAFAHITGMMILEENVLDLGLLIVLTLLGSFTLLYLFYTWFCVLSLRTILIRYYSGAATRDPFMVQPFQGQQPAKSTFGAYPSRQFQPPSYGYSNLARPAY